MPIIESADPSEPLCQGDVLIDITLRSTGSPWDQSEGSTITIQNRLSLVISRPCVAQHDCDIAVAAIGQYTYQKPGTFESFDEAVLFYRNVRDGLTTPDLFYLGQIEGFDGSYCAHLNSLHSIKLPKSADRRAEFIAEKRIGRISPEFARDLHLRLFRSYASLGFDDHNWLSIDDLEAIVNFGDRDVLKIKTDIRDHEARIHALRSQGTGNQSDVEGLSKQLVKIQAKLKKTETQLAPYQEALASRRHPRADQISTT